MPNSDRESQRQLALREVQLLDTPPEPEFDALARLAQSMLRTDMSSITLFDADRQWFKARCGPLAPETERQPALCAAVFESEQPIIVGDARGDDRFAKSRFVTGAPYVRYYAGVPIHARQVDGEMVTIGTLCVLDQRPRVPKMSDLEILQELGLLANALVDARATALRAINISEGRRSMVEHLERERRQFKQAEHMAQIGSWRYDLEQKSTSWSDGVFSIHELPIEAGVPEEKIMSYLPEPYRTKFFNSVRLSLNTGEPFEMTSDLITAKGNTRRVKCLCEVELLHGKAEALIGLIQDITEQHYMEEQLRMHARTDELTKLANRRDFNDVLDYRIKLAKRSGSDLAVILIDLDGFKAVNDTLGHAEGDEVLRAVAKRLVANCVGDYLPARIGGDEFAIVTPIGINEEELTTFKSQILHEVQIKMSLLASSLVVTGSVGYAWSKKAGHQRDSILRLADKSLYNVKRRAKAVIHETTLACSE